jgi:hypothetical protein
LIRNRNPAPLTAMKLSRTRVGGALRSSGVC